MDPRYSRLRKWNGRTFDYTLGYQRKARKWLGLLAWKRIQRENISICKLRVVVLSMFTANNFNHAIYKTIILYKSLKKRKFGCLPLTNNNKLVHKNVSKYYTVSLTWLKVVLLCFEFASPWWFAFYQWRRAATTKKTESWAVTYFWGRTCRPSSWRHWHRLLVTK